MTTAAIIEAHSPNVALQFSGGRDSLALLLHLQSFWDCLTVYYTNSGDALPETLALVDRVRAVVPRFVEIRGRAIETRKRHGWAADVLQAGAGWPWRDHIAGHVPLIDKFFCCFESIMIPMHERMQDDGITLLIRGQRDSDEPKSTFKNGDRADGMTVLFPIADWSSQRVESFIRVQGWEVPPYYAEGATSAPDCMHCTAWLEHGAYPYVARHHPKAARIVLSRLREIRAAVQPGLSALDAAICFNEGGT